MSSNRISGTWIDLDSGDHGELVDSDCVDSWEFANKELNEDISWIAEPDTELDDDYVSVSRALFNQLLVMRNTCTCSR